jgi:2,3-dihydroxybenzoate decarboxylase
VQHIEDARQATDLARKMNDYAANVLVRKSPSRLRTFACVPLQDPEAAAGRGEAGLHRAGMPGRSRERIHQPRPGRSPVPGSPGERTLLATDQRTGRPVYLHPRMPLKSQCRAYEGYPGLAGSAWGFGVETATHALRLMLSGLFDRHPDVNVILGHLGEGLALSLPAWSTGSGISGRRHTDPTARRPWTTCARTST